MSEYQPDRMASKRKLTMLLIRRILSRMLNPDLLMALHYCAAITLTGAITSEYFLFRRGMSIEQVRKLLLADGLAALALLLIFITGVLQVLAHRTNPQYCSPTPAIAPSCCCFS